MSRYLLGDAAREAARLRAQARLWDPVSLNAPLPRRHYDLIFARWVFLFPPDSAPHLRKLVPALKPGGLIAVGAAASTALDGVRPALEVTADLPRRARRHWSIVRQRQATIRLDAARIIKRTARRRREAR